MKNVTAAINLMNIDINDDTKYIYDRNNLTYSNTIVNDLKAINKCYSLEDFDNLEYEYNLQLDVINSNLDYYFNKNRVSTELYSYSKEMYDFYMSTEEANIVQKIIYAFKLFIEKIISLAIKLFRLICIKISEFKAYLQNGLYKKFNKDDFIYVNVRIKAIPINENMADIDNFIDEVYKKNYIIGKLFAWQEDSSNLDKIEEELTIFVENHLKEVDKWKEDVYKDDYSKITVSAHKYIYLYDRQIDIELGSSGKEEKTSKFTDYFKDSKNEVIALVKTSLYDMHNYYNQVGKYGEYNITVGEFLHCKPKEKPKLLEVLGPNFLNKIVTMRKTVDGYIKNLNKLIKKHEYKKYFIKENFEKEPFDNDLNETRNKSIKIIHKSISFLYSLNYYLFMELINIRTSVEKAIKIGCNGNENKILDKISKKPPVRIIKTNNRDYEIGGLTINDSIKQIKIEGFCNDETFYNKFIKFYNDLAILAGRLTGTHGLRCDVLKLFDEFREMFGIEYSNCTFQLMVNSISMKEKYYGKNNFSNPKNRFIRFNVTKEVEEVLVDANTTLYHTTTGVFDRIFPTHKPSMPILFEYPKFFVGYNSPLLRDGSSFLNRDKEKLKKYLFKESVRIYRIPTDLILKDIKSGKARIVVDYDVFSASNSVSVICFEGQSYPVVEVEMTD